MRKKRRKLEYRSLLGQPNKPADSLGCELRFFLSSKARKEQAFSLKLYQAGLKLYQVGLYPTW